MRIPSDFTLILADCHLRMADGVYSNMFVNQNHDTELGGTLEGTDHNIAILGKGRAILDGGNYNGLSEKTHSKEGRPHVTKNCLVLFSNVDGVTVRNIACHNQRYGSDRTVAGPENRISLLCIADKKIKQKSKGLCAE